jgi:ABC-type sugar transport system ATPase subunit
MAAVVFEGVTKRFADVLAVDSLDLEVADGEFIVLLGPSGCGKTTALRMIAGLEHVTEGRLSIGNRLVNDVEPRDRDIAMVFQSYALYPHLSVARNIESPLVVRTFHADGPDRPARKLDRGERMQRVADAARILGLEPVLDRKPAALSGGQRQRVALARAIVARPTAFLMDEPLSNLDAKLRAQTRAELVELHRRLGTTMVYVTHDQVEAMTMATRIAVLAAGRLQQVGTPREIYERPRNLFVAEFIGTPPMNTVPGTVTAGTTVAVGDSRFPLPPTAAGLGEGTIVTVGVRPEHLTIGGDGEVKGIVRHVEWLGHEALVTCEVGGSEAAAPQTFTLRQGGGALPGQGDIVRLRVDPRHVHLFDPTTTERIS